MRALSLVALAFVFGCSSGDRIIRPIDVAPQESSATATSSAGTVVHDSSPTPTKEDVEPGETRFEGTYTTVPPQPGQKLDTTLALVKLDDGKQLVLSYSADSKNDPLIGKRVVVIGTVYVPEGRAITGTHVKARILALAPAR